MYQDTKETELIVEAYDRLQDDESLANAGVMLETCLDVRVGELTGLCFPDFEERPGHVHIQRMEVELYEEKECLFFLRNNCRVQPCSTSQQRKRAGNVDFSTFLSSLNNGEGGI